MAPGTGFGFIVITLLLTSRKSLVKHSIRPPKKQLKTTDFPSPKKKAQTKLRPLY